MPLEPPANQAPIFHEGSVGRHRRLWETTGILIGDVDGWVEGHIDTIYDGEAGVVIGELESLLQSLDPPPDAEGAEENIPSMCALRVVQANNWWDDFWADEHKRRQAA
jgi:hypothetical protein